MIDKYRRYGKFDIPINFIDDYWSTYAKIMKKVIIIKADYSMVSDTIEYYAFCDKFPENLKFSELITYNIHTLLKVLNIPSPFQPIKIDNYWSTYSESNQLELDLI